MFHSWGDSGTNIINKIIAKLILFERPLTGNWDFSGCVPLKSNSIYTMDNLKSVISKYKIRIDLETNNIFKQENILISEDKKVSWLTEIKSVIIQSTN
jgi:hypothetical protein